ncbi:hypothetical protein ZIOFF_027951 [Zingiber officinale]|uniref:Uncharacterized protein n=1 Tax=Zingiber officinale TaxID=94328 RepID=A0A8J5GMD0_ZINOF|nr:hypothetical protein ZIOFF_027951 [Zingiber officinale]
MGSLQIYEQDEIDRLKRMKKVISSFSNVGGDRKWKTLLKEDVAKEFFMIEEVAEPSCKEKPILNLSEPEMILEAKPGLHVSVPSVTHSFACLIVCLPERLPLHLTGHACWLRSAKKRNPPISPGKADSLTPKQPMLVFHFSSSQLKPIPSRVKKCAPLQN